MKSLLPESTVESPKTNAAGIELLNGLCNVTPPCIVCRRTKTQQIMMRSDSTYPLLCVPMLSWNIYINFVLFWGKIVAKDSSILYIDK